MNPIIPAVVIGGVVYEVSTKGAAAAPAAAPAPVYPPGATLGQMQAINRKRKVGNLGMAAKVPTGTYDKKINGPLGIDPTVKGQGQPGPGANDPNLQKAADLATEEAKKAFQDMSDVEKSRAADTLNDQLKLDPPLNGNEDWDTVAAVVAGAAGAAAGAALCGPICGKAGALLGAFVGKDLADYISKIDWNDINSLVPIDTGDIKDALNYLNPF